MRVAVVGGGPGGLFLAALVSRGLPNAEVVVLERNQRSDAFGFGVVFSDATLRTIDAADPVLREGLADFGTHWDRIAVWNRGERHEFAGNGMAAIHRRRLLGLLQDNAEQAGATLRFGEEAPPVAQLSAEFDVVVGADGTNSSVRRHLGNDVLGHSTETAAAKFIWFGTTFLFDGLTFVHRESEHGTFAVHGYPISSELSTFIVETDEPTWRRAGLDRFDVTQPPGTSDVDSQHYLAKLFADDIDGADLVANNSRWGNFVTRRTRTWHQGNIALLGDAVHTAHFSVGSGTKMAMEDAVVLAEEIVRHADDTAGAFSAYEEARQPKVERIQDSARPSLSWWERFGRYRAQLDPLTFAFHFFSRTIDIERIAKRDPQLVQDVRSRWQEREGATALRTSLDLPGTRAATSRVLTLQGEDAELVLLDDVGEVLRVDAGIGTVIQGAILVEAPESEELVDSVLAALPDDVRVALVRGGCDLPRMLVCEELRLDRGCIVVLAGDVDDAVAETLVLSGRVDAVARTAGTGDAA
jgi:salicyloyl-CoA 5-hydroxylase